MDFIEAVKLAIKTDKYIVRKSDGSIRFYVSDNQIYSKTQVGKDTWAGTDQELTIEELLAEDWEIYQEPKLHTFEEAIVALKRGKTIKRASVPQWTYNITICSFDEKEIMANDWIII